MSDRDFAPVDATEIPRFADVATFMRTRRYEPAADVDIGLVGVPFDLGVNYRNGPREGPAAVRQASRLIRQQHPTTGVRPYEAAHVADLGDAPVNPLDLADSITRIETFFAQLKGLDIRPIAVGGDHTVPLPILRALAKERPVGVLQFDAHADVLDTLCGTKINHATFMRRGVEEGLIDPKRVVQLGLRGSRFGADDVRFGEDAGFEVITIDRYEDLGRAATIDLIRARLFGGPIYVTLDIDGSTRPMRLARRLPEIGGLLPRDVQVILRALQGQDVVGADICEVAPALDPTGVTAVTAANFLFELLCVVASSPCFGAAAAR